MSFFPLLFHAQTSSPFCRKEQTAHRDWPTTTCNYLNCQTHQATSLWAITSTSIYSRWRPIHQPALRLYRIKGRAKEVSAAAAAAQKPSSPQTYNLISRQDIIIIP
jgi:hypothetical protein